ncbi:Arm DNA-binding domain-containing protein [Solibacillus sp. CAU 1738]|uniref:Arm DNA-binding domain-containing protein n=1 Tax=Solibacillus sp. CAU 1738 TaxID=3140363 RepID=UPI003261A869
MWQALQNGVHFADGKSRSIRKGEFKTKKDARIAAVEVEARLQKGAKVVTKNIPFVECFRNWKA